MDFDNVINIENYRDKSQEMIIETEYSEYNQKPARSYKIKRNDPCPCGSGKKYKKCCANVTPKKPIEEYIEVLGEYLGNGIGLEDFAELNEVYEIVKKADKDYPMEPIFSEMAGIISFELNQLDKAKNYLLKNYRIVKDDIDEEVALYLLEILLELDENKTVEEIGEKLLEIYDNPVLYIILAETKFQLGKKEEGYEYGLKAYLKSQKDIYTLNTILKIFIENGMYIKPLKLLKQNYSRFFDLDQELDSNEENVNLIFEESVEYIFDISTEGKYDQNKYIKYLDKLIEIFKVISPNQSLDDDKIKKVSNLISGNYQLSSLITKIFYTFENYEWLTRNRNILLDKAKKDEIYLVFTLLYHAAFLAGDYEYIVEQKDKILNHEFIEDNDPQMVFDIYKQYFMSLYFLSDKMEMAEFIGFLNFIFQNDIITLLMNMINSYNNFEQAKILNFIRKIDVIDFIDNEKLLNLQISVIVNNLEYLDILRYNEKEKVFLKKLIKKYEKMDKDNFINCYARWVLAKQENKKHKDSIEEIAKRPAKSSLALTIKYLVIIKFLDPKLIIENPPQSDMLSDEDLKFYKTIAKIKVGEIKDIRKIYSEFPNEIQSIIDILGNVLTASEYSKFMPDYY